MSSETENAVIRYTTDGNEPGETSPVYTEPLELAPGVTVKARAYEDVYHEPSDSESVELPEPVPIDITLGMVLKDGSTVVYDRGEEFGDYATIFDEIARISPGVDDGSAESQNWRFLIADNLANVKLYKWGKDGMVSLSDTVGGGLYNTETIKNTLGYEYGDMCYYAQGQSDKTGYHWFVPSSEELEAVCANNIIDLGNTQYWTSVSSASDQSRGILFTPPNGFGTSFRTNFNSVLLFRRI